MFQMNENQMQREIAHLQKEILRVETEAKALEDRKKQLPDQASAQRKTINDLNRETKMLDDSIKHAAKKTEQLQKEIEQIASMTAQQQSELAQRRDLLAQLIEEQKGIERERNSIGSDSRRKKQELQRLVTQLKPLQDMLNRQK